MEVRSHTKHEWISLICALLEPAVLLFNKQFLTLFTWKLVVCVRERESTTKEEDMGACYINSAYHDLAFIQAGSKTNQY